MPRSQHSRQTEKTRHPVEDGRGARRAATVKVQPSFYLEDPGYDSRRSSISSNSTVKAQASDNFHPRSNHGRRHADSVTSKASDATARAYDTTNVSDEMLLDNKDQWKLLPYHFAFLYNRWKAFYLIIVLRSKDKHPYAGIMKEFMRWASQTRMRIWLKGKYVSLPLAGFCKNPDDIVQKATELQIDQFDSALFETIVKEVKEMQRVWDKCGHDYIELLRAELRLHLSCLLQLQKQRSTLKFQGDDPQLFEDRVTRMRTAMAILREICYKVDHDPDELLHSQPTRHMPGNWPNSMGLIVADRVSQELAELHQDSGTRKWEHVLSLMSDDFSDVSRYTSNRAMAHFSMKYSDRYEFAPFITPVEIEKK